jgi:hypothetical protein
MDLGSSFLSNNPMMRANAYWTWAMYYGWHEFDSSPLKLKVKEVEARYGVALVGEPEIHDEFTDSYIAAALWASTDDNGVSLDQNYDVDDISPETLKAMRKDSEAFQHSETADLKLAYAHSGYTPDLAGHDFWLTRERHGAGFWDRGLGDVGKRLTDAAHAYGSYALYVGDDGKIHSYSDVKF